MAETNELTIVVKARDEASKMLKGLQKEVQNFGGSAKEFLGNAVADASAVAQIGLAGLVAGATASVFAFADSEKASAQLEAVLKSTGGAVGYTAGAITDMATELSKMTAYEDDAIISGQNLLLTFTNIKGPIFKEATAVMLDMSTALGQDLKSSAIQLGKALNDPIKGVTALQRVGVSFTEKQKEQIQTLVDSGKTMEAQKLILKELNTEFGGSAVKAGQTFAGTMERIKNSIGNLMEVIGAVIVDFIQPLVGAMDEFTKSMDTEVIVNRAERAIVSFAQQAYAYLKPVIDFVIANKQFFIDFFSKFGITLAILVPTLALLGGAFSLLTNPLFLITGFLATMWYLWENNRIMFTLVAGAVGGFLVGALVVLATTLWTTVIPALWATIAPFLPFILAGMAVAGLVYLIISNWSGIAGFFQGIWDNILRGINWLKDNWLYALGFILGFFITLPLKVGILIGELIATIWNKLTSINWGAIWSNMWKSFENACASVVDAVGRLWNYISNINWGSMFSNLGKGVGNGIIGLIEGAINGALSGIPGKPKISIPRFASGVENFEGGLAVVGERGPELVTLPSGSNVIPNDKLGGAGINITVNLGTEIFLGTPVELRRAGVTLAQIIAQELKAQGLKVDQLGALI